MIAAPPPLGHGISTAVTISYRGGHALPPSSGRLVAPLLCRFKRRAPGALIVTCRSLSR